MADNTTLNAGSGGDTFRTLEDGAGIKWPVGVTAFATTLGAPDVLQVVTPDSGLPVHQQTGATWAVSIVGQTGAVAISDGGGSVTVDGTVGVSGSVAVTGPLTDAQLRAAAVPVSLASVPSHPVTNAGTFAVQLSAALPAGANNIGDVDVLTLPAITLAAAQTLATVTTVGTVTNLAQLGGQAVAMGTGTRSAGTQRVTIATDDVVPASQSGAWTVQPGNTPNTTPWLTSDRPATSGGLDMHKTVSAASTNATSVKAAAGQVYDVQVFNINAAPRYLKLYNKASAPTVGTDVPVKTILIPGNTAGAGVVKEWAKGLAFSLGIAFALTTGVSDADTGAVASAEVVVNIDYK